MSEQGTAPSAPLPLEPPRKYPILRIIATVYRVLAYVVAVAAVVGVVVGVYVITRPSPLGYGADVGSGIAIILLSVVYGALGFISLLATSEVILLFIDLESNTRENNTLLRGIIDRR